MTAGAGHREPYRVLAPAGPEVPLLVSIPHTGEEVPPEVLQRMEAGVASTLPDTDWHLHRLYDFVPTLGATVLHARYSRYVVDLNRPPDGARLYPGRFETELVPTRTFAGDRVYREGEEPGPQEVRARVRTFWEPYHERLARELETMRSRFGRALLFEAHSIRSHVPLLHPDPLPDLILGDGDGKTAAAPIRRAVLGALERTGLRVSSNRPFRGGFLTRRYGAPGEGVHALQLEMCQRLYMDEDPPFPYSPEKAEALRPVLEAALRAFLEAGTG